MNARNNDLNRIQEIYDVVVLTNRQIIEAQITKENFLNPQTAIDELVTEGIENRIFRIAEEGGQLSEETEAYGFDRKAMRGLRNILAHDYGQVDRRIVWNVVQKDFPQLLKACQTYCNEKGLALKESF